MSAIRRAIASLLYHPVGDVLADGISREPRHRPARPVSIVDRRPASLAH
jgi:hypothetical protein